MRASPWIAVALVALSTFAPSIASARTITVHSLTAADASDAICTLREALADVTGGAPHGECAPTGAPGVLVVQLPAGTASLVGAGSPSASIWDLSGALVIRGAGAGATVLRRGAGGGPTRLFGIRSGADVTLEALTVEGFDGEAGTGAGGAIFLDRNGALTVRDTTFRDCTTPNAGGAISAPFLGGTSTRVTIVRSTFVDTSAGRGGALDLWDVTLEVDGSSFSGCSGSENVLQYVTELGTHSATIRDSTFRDNVSTRLGSGALTFRGPAAVTIERTTFEANASNGGGGAILTESPTTIRGSTFTGNRTGGSGGAIYAGAALTIFDSTFESNEAGNDAGAIFAGYATGRFERCLFAHNRADNGGAIVHHAGDTITLLDSIFVGNDVPTNGVTVTAGPDVAIEGGAPGAFTVARTQYGSAIRTSTPMTIHGSCFVGGVRQLIVTSGASVDATGNYWTATDPGVRGDARVDSSGELAVAPASCDPAAALVHGGLTTASSVSGTATPGEDYVPLALPVVFAPGESDVVVPVVALLDGVDDPDEWVALSVDFDGVSSAANVRIVEAGISADLAISKTADVTEASIGDAIVFTLTVSNAGPGDAADVVVTDALPAGLTLVDASIDAPPGTTASCVPGPPARCTLSGLAAGASATVTVRTIVSAAGDIRNAASVSSASDPDPSDDVSEVVVRVLGDGGVASGDGGLARRDGGIASGDGGPSTGTTGGCSCRAGGRASGSIALGLLLALAVVVAVRRR